ncbi:ATP-grasp domain-containing protein [Microlunatus aurantiacus]|uniref:ATP-grasp domain-containing protein n=1 Tax=Microlunatus aurantiacus TaxID=446786 RepID=UPI0031E3347A
MGVDLTPLEAIGYDRVLAVPPAGDLGYGPAMRDVVAAVAPDVIIPTVQDELPQIAVLADILGRAATLGRADKTPARVVTAGAVPSAIAADKLLTMWALAAVGVPVPVHAPANAFASAADAIAWAGGPVVVKPRVSRGGRGVVLVEEPADVDWSTVGPAHVVQSFAGGTEYAPQTYRAVDGTVRSYVLEKTVLKQGRVGNAADAIRVPDGSRPEIAQLAVATVEALGLVGPVDMDIRLDDAGRPLVLEVNGRFGALSALAPELLAGVLEDHLPR